MSQGLIPVLFPMLRGLRGIFLEGAVPDQFPDTRKHFTEQIELSVSCVVLGLE